MSELVDPIASLGGVPSPLIGARLAVISEPDSDFGINAAFVKNATGGNVQHARRIYGHPIEFEPTATIWVDTNFQPKADHGDDALWNRLKYIPFRQTVPLSPDAEGFIEDFDEKLDAEMPGILAWAVQGCLAWRETGIEPPHEVLEATKRSREEQDPLRDFIDEWLELGDDFWTPRSGVYQVYQHWANDAIPRSEHLTQRSFNKCMEDRGLTKVEKRDGKRTVKAWAGCRLAKDPDVDDDPWHDETSTEDLTFTRWESDEKASVSGVSGNT